MVKRRFTLRHLGLITLLLVLIVVHHRLLLGEAFFWGLPSLQFVPWRAHAFELLRSGTLPLWNFYNGAGAPLLANYQSALFYPLNWTGLFLPLAWSMSVMALLHLFIGGWGMARLAQRLGASELGAAVSALAFGLSGYLIARLGTYPTISAAAWLPWLLWSVLGLSRGVRLSGFWLASFMAMQLLAGHAQTTWYSLLLTGLFALWLAASTRRPRFLLTAALAALVATAIAAPQLLPTFELLRASQRGSGVSAEFAMNFSYAPARLLNLFAPNVFGTPANGSYFTNGAFFEDAVYIGLLPLFAAVAALFGWRRRHRSGDALAAFVPFWLAIVAIGMLLALGDHTPFFPFLYDRIPTFSLFQAPVRWHLWTVMGLCILAAIGTTWWSRAPRLRRWTRRGLVASVGLAIAAGLMLVSGADANMATVARALIIAALIAAAACALTLTQPAPADKHFVRWAALVMLVVALDLGCAAWDLNPTAPSSFFAPNPSSVDMNSPRLYWPQEAERSLKFETFFRFEDYRIARERLEALRASGLPNLNLLDRQPLFNNFDPLLVGSFSRYLDLIDQEPAAAPLLLAAAGVGAYFAPDGARIVLPERATVAWLVPSACWFAQDQEVRAALLNPNWDPREQVFLVGEGECSPTVSPITGVVGPLVPGQGLLPKFFVEVANAADAWLVIALTAYPGWRASLNGEPAALERANLAFVALHLPAGEHRVELRYEPNWLVPAPLIGLLGLVGLSVLFRFEGRSWSYNEIDRQG
ncbi:MAG: YfhO family protein [Aggregatilineales bacterium]